MGVLLILLALTASAAIGQQPSEWPQFQRDAAHTGSGEGPEPPYRIAWEFPVERVNQRGASPAVIAGGLVVTVGPDAVHALDIATGDEVWSVPREPGPPVAPAIVADGDRSLLVYTEGGGIEDPSGTPTPGPTTDAEDEGDQADRSTVLAIDLENQRLAWKLPYELEGAAEASPVIEGDTVLVGDTEGTLAALDAATGVERWKASAGGEVLRPPAADGDHVVLSLREGEEVQPTVSAFDLGDGERVWSVSPSVAAANPFTTIPSISGGRVYLGSFDRVVRALSLEDGGEMWTNAGSFRSYAPITAPAVIGDELYLGDDAGGLHRFAAATGEIAWSHALNAGITFGAPVVVGSVVVVGLDDGRLAALDRDSGDLVWEVDAGEDLGPIAVGPEHLVVARTGPGSGIVAFEHDPDATLMTIVSPSKIRAGSLVGLWVAAAAILVVLLLVPLRLVAARVRPSAVQADAADGVAPGEGTDDVAIEQIDDDAQGPEEHR
ncbi:MAG: PQQ-binding-like beta-propeller repeat protein [Actinomycetota bacterium]